MPPENMPAVPIYTPLVPRSSSYGGSGQGGAYTSDGAPHDKGGRVLGNGADQAPDLEDEDGAQKRRLDVEPLIDVSEHGLQRCCREEVRRAICRRRVSYQPSPALLDMKSVSDLHQPCAADQSAMKSSGYHGMDGGGERRMGLTISFTLLYSAVIAPSAGAMIVWSSATRKMHRHSEVMRAASFMPVR